MSPVVKGICLRDVDMREPRILLIHQFPLLLNLVRICARNDEELIVRPDGRICVPYDHEAAQPTAEPTSLSRGEVRLPLQRRKGDSGYALSNLVKGTRSGVEVERVDLSLACPWRWGLLYGF